MQAILIVGIVVFTGFIFGEIATKIRLPKVTGYILAGVLLDPQLTHFIPKNFIDQTTPVTNICLSLIAFSIGGSLYYRHIKRLGKGIIWITLFEAECAFFVVTIGFIATGFFLLHDIATGTLIALSVLVASLASATDPSGTLAVREEYKAKGNVISTILGVSALDDVMGIINFSFAVVIAQTIVAHKAFSISSSILAPCINIVGAVLLGIGFGVLFNIITWRIRKETEGVIIVVIFGLLALCFGVAGLINVDQLLASMTMGAIVVNFNRRREKIFGMLERYTDELIFVFFFTLCGMQLDFSVLTKCFVLILFFALFRFGGKYFGTFIGAGIAKSPPEIKKYTAGGLVPMGGVIVGLALMLKQNPVFANKIADIVISIIIGATVIHELLGPIFVKLTLKKAGEIKTSQV